ncbi:MAG: F0F1 ATP synthase subunit A [Rikenellaceae bacterium]|nr:F0F1 ATP synthase subunit A [Rikenellaceae bacterium]MCL2693236.1 F0F1 ATP synthase subunit A [Rikenellaceae bacterium]
MKRTLFILMLTILGAVANVRAETEEVAVAIERFDTAEMIVEHVGDSYWWHITRVGGRDLTIFLPVIARERDSGWHIFSSRHIAHGAEYRGFRIADEGRHRGKLIATADGGEYRPWDVSITKTTFALLFNSAVIVALFLWVARRYRRRSWKSVPRGFVGAIEMLMVSIEDDIIKKSIGHGYERFSPYLLTAFFFILINNLMGLIPFFPGGANVMGNISITIVLAFCSLVAMNLFSNREYWREIFWPDAPIWLKLPVPLLPAIEFFGVLSKPVALMIRLTANVMGGHIVLISVTSIIFVAATMGAAASAGLTVFSVIFSIFMTAIELLVASLQAYVFTLLSAVFIGLSRPKSHKTAVD